jgi:glycosyltransferase involved in cell wall biosynthesis
VNVLHVTPAFYPALVYGGPVRALYDLCRALAEAGDAVRVLTTDANGAGRVEAPAGQEVTLGRGGGASLRVLYARRRWRHTVSPELLGALRARLRWAQVAHLTAVYSFPTLPTLLAARLAGTPLVVSPRGSFGAWGQRRRRAAKTAINLVLRGLTRRGVTFHATAQTEAADIRAVMGDVPVAVVPNGIDAAEFAALPPDGATWLRHLASLKPQDGPLIGCLGRLHEKKGLDRLVGAVPALRASWPGVHVLLAGPDDGVEQGRLAAAAAALGVSDRVHFLGGLYGADRIGFLAGLDVFVLPSLDENFANAVAESLASGTPAVVSRHCPWPELEARRCGRWIDADAGAVAAAVKAVLRDDPAAMGQRGRAFVMAERTIGAAAGSMREAYRQTVGGR